jgi:cyclic pyranopterin phosphate synthase
MALDSFGRTLNYLRISVTDMCNLRCVYCMPEDMRFRPAKELLQDDEILRLVRLFAGLGFDKIRFTGGEPTLRENFVELVRRARDTTGVRRLALTTNGILLDYLAVPLREAGLSRVNVSMDTLHAQKFRQITRWGNLRDVLKGIEAAERAGLEVKINCVVVRGFNDTVDVVDLARTTLATARQVRFIEIMPFGGITEFQRSHIVPEAELRATIEKALGPMDLQNNGFLDGEARVYRLRDARGTLGFISSVTNPFCAGCNRARLTADGKLRLCLLRDTEIDLRAPLREGASDEDLADLLKKSLWRKPWGHGLANAEYATTRAMSEIGG